MTTAPDSSQPIRRARSRAIVFGVLALLVASATAYTTWWVVSRYEQKLDGVAEEDGAIQVVVAARDLRPGEVLVDADLKLGSRPANVALDQLFSNPAAIVGKTVGDKILAGEAIRFQRLTMGGASLAVDEVIDPGSRAVTIRTNYSAAVGGLLQPGFYVDVIVTIRPETKDLAADWVTETILQGVRVIAVNDAVATGPAVVEGRRDDEERYEPRDVFVTLEVEPAEAEEIALASTRGLLQLSLRARDDFEMVDPGSPLVTNALVGLPQPVAQAQSKRLERKRIIVQRIAPAREPVPGGPSVEVTRGTNVSVEQFDKEGHRIKTQQVGR